MGGLVLVCTGDHAIRLALMDATAMPTLHEVLGLVARAPDVTHGVTSVFERIGPAIEATRLALEYADASKAPVVWRDPASIGAALPVAPGQWPVAGTSGVLASLVVHREEPFSPGDHQQFSAIAETFAIALARDAQFEDLQRELTARAQEVAHQRAFVECVVDSLPDGLHVVDRDYRIHAWNHKRETGLQGVARSDAIGRTIFEVMHRQPAALLKQEFDEVFASGRLQQFQMESSAFGEPRAYRISKIPMRMGGGPVTHVITIGEDITDWKAALDRTAQSEKLAALGQLAAGVMHEINNPLATIAACAESLAMQQELGPPATPPTELLRIIDLEVQRCKKIVNGLLDFARPKPVHRELFDLDEVVQQSLFLLQHHPRFKRVTLVMELEGNGHAMVHGDADQLAQVLIALAMNALDATPEGGRVVIRTSAERADDGQAIAQLEVEDEGPGIPRTLQAKVFEPFFTTKPPGQGTGLGLAICYGIVNDHGGQLELVSPEGAGAVFRVSLPIGIAP
jgi:two-component system NtrC family sensor kinase